MKLYHTSFDDRLKLLRENGVLSQEDYHYLLSGYRGSSLRGSSEVIEQFIGVYSSPLAIIEQVPINNDLVPVVLSLEQQEVVPGINKSAKRVRNYGELCAVSLSKGVTGQLFYGQSQRMDIESYIRTQKELILFDANTTVASSLKSSGGGVIDLGLRQINEQECVLEMLVDTADLMGCNIVNVLCLWLKERVKSHTKHTAFLSAVSNYSDHQIYQAEIFLHGCRRDEGQELIRKFNLAKHDISRAVNNNKSIANGVISVLHATGNDTRALSANMHAYAARSGEYQPLSHFSCTEDGLLYGSVTMPMMVGSKGIAIKANPTAQRCLDIMKIETADALAIRAIACGLLSNLASLYDHVHTNQHSSAGSAHCKNIALQLDVSPLEFNCFVDELEKEMRIVGKVTMVEAREILQRIRQEKIIT